MPDQATQDAREWQRERDIEDQEAARGAAREEIEDYRADLRVCRYLEEL